MTARSESARALRVFQVVWVIGFLVGTTTHTVDLIVGGLNAYSGFPLGVRLFWMTLTILDPATAALIIFRRRSGIVLGSAVMIADIAVNWTAFAVVGGLSFHGVISQGLFAVLIFVTIRPLWIWFGQPLRHPHGRDPTSPPRHPRHCSYLVMSAGPWSVTSGAVIGALCASRRVADLVGVISTGEDRYPFFHYARLRGRLGRGAQGHHR